MGVHHYFRRFYGVTVNEWFALCYFFVSHFNGLGRVRILEKIYFELDPIIEYYITEGSMKKASTSFQVKL